MELDRRRNNRVKIGPCQSVSGNMEINMPSNKLMTQEEWRWMEKSGKRFRKARKDQGIKQKDLAEMIGASPSQLCDFENGKGSLRLYH